MPARVLACQTFTITIDVEIKEEDLLIWLNSKPNLFDYLGQKPEYNLKVKSLDEDSKFNIHSIENSHGKKLTWDGSELNVHPLER
jgi:hypothetical protein